MEKKIESQSQCHSVPFQQLLLFPLVVEMQQLSRAKITRRHSQKEVCIQTQFGETTNELALSTLFSSFGMTIVSVPNLPSCF